jgi:hypothetical protein
MNFFHFRGLATLLFMTCCRHAAIAKCATVGIKDHLYDLRRH